MYTRVCPICNNTITYNVKRNCKNMEGKPCKLCHPKLLRESKAEYKNVCISCGVESPVKYKPRVKTDWKCEDCRNTKENTCAICNTKFLTRWNAKTCSPKCMHILIAQNIGGPDVVNVSQIDYIRKTRRVGGGKSQSKENNGMWGKQHSNETKMAISQLARTRKRKPHSENTKRKMRIAATERMMNRGLRAGINPNACLEIDKFSKQFGYNVKHGLNGGEHYIKELGYFLDGYDEEKNIVIEYDELHHLTPIIKEKDEQRQSEIIDLLKCKFIRLSEQVDGSIEVKHIN